MAATADQWFDGLDPAQRRIAEALRDLVLAASPDLTEAVKWGQPCYSRGTRMVCYIQKAKGHVSLGFRDGAALTAPEGLLSGSGKQMRHIVLPLDRPIDTSVINGLLRQALTLAG